MRSYDKYNVDCMREKECGHGRPGLRILYYTTGATDKHVHGILHIPRIEDKSGSLSTKSADYVVQHKTSKAFVTPTIGC